MTLEDPALLGTIDAAQTRLAGRYVVLGLLGVGGMGSVYRVRDTALDEVVALKMLRDDDRDSEALTRFRDEVKLARQIGRAHV